jgi:hypothetical protein
MGTSLNGLTPAGTYPGLIKTGDNAPIDGTLKTLSDGNGNNLPMAVSTTAVNFTNQLQQSGVAVPTASQVAAKQDTLVSGTNIKTINGTSVLGPGNIAVVTSPSGVSGAIQFSNGSAFASDASNLFWDDTNNRLGIGTNAPTYPLEVIGQNAMLINSNLFGAYQAFKNSSGATHSIGFYGDAFVTLIGGTATTFFQGNGTNTFGNGLASLGARVGIKGSGSTSATTSLLVQNSAGTEFMKISDNGVTTFGGTVQNLGGPIQATQFLNVLNNPFIYGTTYVYAIQGTTPVVTSGQRDGFLGQFTFAPTSGNAILNVFNVSPTINQTGGANGITRGLYINPTLTAAADFRAIQTTAGKIIFGGLPTSSAGLVSGQIWNDAGTIKIV